ncbi:Na(+)-translocating NADH-quinone reductase subunit C [Thorsellia anophelis]|uniref:Na(+)-translocating NADH-quinone reductase subunit C n=1 Tax=Thorsellia anophelis DSM 18579 TaxID=1123402 RepID=A0A1H9YNW0_9GAMM|nr:Na(+)-translocating NADH-quinone reductase subunit C [Thorsellia anophelis]SES70294.1 Na+-transporting NADH:ubiquinone oxidoreductase subunit C [Thorsellia anophelis DSM 18579]
MANETDIKSQETPFSIMRAAFIICLICSVIVSAAAIFLNEKQAENRRIDRQRSILEVARLIEGRATPEQINQIYNQFVQPRLVDLRTGQFTDELSVEGFDALILANDPNRSFRVPAEKDIANLSRIENFSLVYLVLDKEHNLDKLILPVRGPGLWGQIYGFLAIDGDLKKASNIIFYKHAETPGLGGEIENPRWRDQWNGVVLFNESGEVVIDVVQQRDPNSAVANQQIQGLAGATLTSHGVRNFVQFWLGDAAFGPFIANLRAMSSDDIVKGVN